jgi:hypothetical protein
MGAEMKGAPLLSYGSWTLRGLGLKRMAAGGIVIESARWALQGRFPALAHTGAAGAPGWVHLFYAAELFFFWALP